MNKIALVGNPNSGKTTLFNALTGSNQHVGNWPGVTVEKKEGIIKFENKEYKLIDLPGTYSLGAFSEDEVIARDFILNENPDIIINVVDATNLERNLYLTTQLLEMNQKVVIALNMMDEAKKSNILIDINKFSKKFKVPVIETIASKRQGINELIKTTVENISKDHNNINLDYGDSINKDYLKVYEIINNYELDYPTNWIVIKSLEQDKITLTYLQNTLKDADFKKIKDILNNNPDYEIEIVDSRYKFIKGNLKGVITYPDEKKETITDKIDKIATHKYLGLPFFALVMFVVFQLTFLIGEDVFGELVVSAIESISGGIENFLININANEVLIAFITEGIIPGLSAVFEFIPLILVLYFFMGILEDTGYMARAAYVMDDIMRALGLQGKAFIPMIVGFGCNVPGVMATRTLDSEKDRMISILINPFMSCGAKIHIYLVFVAAFFPNNGGLVLFSLYFLGIIVALIMARIFSKTLFKGEVSEFIMELPPYRLPAFRSVVRDMWDKVWGFVKRAGSIIFVVVSLLWVLSVLPVGVEPSSQESILGQIGTFIAPIFKPAGYGNWQAAVSLFAGIVAKEAVVGTLGLVYAGVSEGPMLVSAIQQTFTPLTSISFMVMVLLYTPCAATIATIKQETNSHKWAIFAALYTFAIGWVMSVLVYQIGSLLGF